MCSAMHAEIEVRTRAERRDGHALAFQVAMVSDGLVGEQLVAAAMDPRERGDRLALIDRENDRGGEGGGEVGLAAPDHGSARRPLHGRHVADVGKAVRAQQLPALGTGAQCRCRRSWSSRTEVVSGGPSSASDSRGPNTPAAAANDALARKSRRFCLILIKASCSLLSGRRQDRQLSHAFSSRLSSLKKRQSVPSAMICCGVDLIMPTSWRRSA